MAAVKFFMEFMNVQGDLCTVNFIFEDYSDAPIRIYGGPQPFVLGEFNTDTDIFKPVRPQQATIQVLASAAGIKLEDFLTDNDTDITVRFDFGDYDSYWQGILSQEDIEEIWVSSNHILTLRADDGFGRLKTEALNDGTGARLVGTYTPFAYVQYAANSVIGTFLYSRIYSNLFHTSMTFGTNQTGFDQCLIDARAFEDTPNVFDDGYTVIEKINRAWSMTLFQWNNVWVFLRIPEMFTDGNLIGFNTNRPTIGSRQSANRRYDIEIDYDSDIRLIMPEPIKTVLKPAKNTTINYDWTPFNQLICNQSFQAGTFLQDGTKTITDGAGNSILINYNEYTVDQWNPYEFGSNGTVARSVQLIRREEYSITGLTNNYFVIPGSGITPTGGGPGEVATEAFSCRFYVKYNDILKFSVNYKTDIEFAPYNTQLIAVARLVLTDDVSTYYYDFITDTWVTSSATYGNVYISYNSSVGIKSAEWNTVEIETKSIPIDGWIYCYLVNWYGVALASTIEAHFSEINIDVVDSLSRQKNRKVKGDFDKYTIDRQVIKNELETVSLDSTRTQNLKGCLLNLDGFNLLNDEWYRRKNFNYQDSTAEQYAFKRQHALAKWYMNRDYKTKLDVNLFGLKWVDGSGVTYPIGIINTIKLTRDLPGKIFAIANLKEIDFMNCTWGATLVEVFDDQVVDNEPDSETEHIYDYYYE
jgi:hypothetical protein